MKSVTGKHPGLPHIGRQERPRILLVDDHPGVLKAISRILATEFEVAGLASDGLEALDLARRIEPDAIVLDVNMPRLTGVETLQGLERSGSQAPVVFLSQVDDVRVISQAFRYGARGYVMKSRIVSDLAPALDHALSGRLFMPSPPSLASLAGGRRHAMQLHDESYSVDRLGAFFDAALRHGDATCVIATKEIREALGTYLATRGWNIPTLLATKRYLTIDTAEALHRFMRDGMPDAGRLAEIAMELNEYRLAGTDGPSPRLTVLGSMAESLNNEGNAAAAIALEHLWDEVTKNLPFLTVCAYAESCFGNRERDFWRTICGAHTAVTHANAA
jgi:DNA-binding NarL/FixJ family response regulator